MAPSPEGPPEPPTEASSQPLSIEELRARLSPHTVLTSGLDLSSGERLALERVRALEVQLLSAQQRERELTELAIRDGDALTVARAQIDEYADRAERTDRAEKALADAENRAEMGSRRAELIQGELESTRRHLDRLRSQVVDLEASLRRALSEVSQIDARVREAEMTRDAARHEAALAQAQAAGSEARAVAAESRIAELSARLSSLEARLAELSRTGGQPEPEPSETRTIVDLREEEEKRSPSSSPWSEWRGT